MRFRPDDRILELLVGEELYTSGDAAMRELVQNAEDACQLQALVDPGFEPLITVRFSREEGWVEVQDNGIGMDEEVLEKSFAAVGAPREEAGPIKEILSAHPENAARQIARFGIGVLSCFGVAGVIEVYTKMENADGIAYRIRDYNEDFLPLDPGPKERGTRIRLILQKSGPMSAADVPTAVAKHVRHADHVLLEDADSGDVEEIAAEWFGEDADGAIPVDDPCVTEGYLALNPDWGRKDVVGPRVILCNGGFLVSDEVEDLLPSEAVGYIGELDIVPNALRILMNREGFKKDQSWREFQRRLMDQYHTLISRYVQEVRVQLVDGFSDDERELAVRRLVVLAHGPTAELLEDGTKTEIGHLLSEVVLLSVPHHDHKTTPAKIVESAAAQGETVYAVKSESETQKFRSRSSAPDATLQVTEIARAEIRVHLLQAKGAPVVRCKRRRFHERIGGRNTHVEMHELDVLQACGKEHGVAVKRVDQATSSELDLEIASESALVSRVLELEEDLRIAELPHARGQVVRDYSGRLLNSAHQEVQEVLRFLPEAVGNPVRRRLLQIYMELANFRFGTARRGVVELLTEKDLEEQAAWRGGELQRQYLRRCLARILPSGDEMP